MKISDSQDRSGLEGSHSGLAGAGREQRSAILPLRDMVVFPLVTIPIMVSAKSAQLVEDALKADRTIGLLTVRNAETDEPRPQDLYAVGTLCKVLHANQNEDGSYLVLVKGLSRFRVEAWLEEDPYLKAQVRHSPETVETGIEIEALQQYLHETVAAVFKLMPNMPEDVSATIRQIEDPLQLAYGVASNMKMDLKARQSLLEHDSVQQKLREVLTRLLRKKEKLDIQKKIQSEVHEEMSSVQRKHFLRQQLKAIQKELGEEDEGGSESDEYAERIEKAFLSAEAREEALRELERLRHMSPQAAEYPLIKTYLDWLLELPWDKRSETHSDTVRARAVLDEDHYGLKEVKERLIEFIAVGNLTAERGTPAVDEGQTRAMGVILCLSGPPGVGKTSLGRSVARALGREFTRMSLGGVRDEAEIRGHRRTYVGAMPGRIIQALKRAGSRNPVFMLDEIDKLGQSWRGDPSSALLEVLDPAQNSTFRDHYLDVDFDLSEVIFIATANQLDTVPGPLRDRLEVIELDGYTEFEKLEIGKRHLVPRQLAAHGLKPDELTFSDEALGRIIADYTREAGVRNLEREIAAICRKAIVRITEDDLSQVTVTPEGVRDFLKKPRYESGVAEAITIPGIATGLAVTPVGGDILHVEASKMPGKGRLTLTGQLGDVMRESAQIAHSYVRTQAQALGIDPANWDRTDVHLHVPAGALPKDGPSAGVAMVMALASLYSGAPLRSDVGITGEMTLRGRVLPVGGIKMKVLAAHRAGLKQVVLPEKNTRDLEELPSEVRESITFVTLDQINETVIASLMVREAQDEAGFAGEPEVRSEQESAPAGAASAP